MMHLCGGEAGAARAQDEERIARSPPGLDVRAHETLRPVLEEVVDDWPEYMASLTAFRWPPMLTSGRRQRDPVDRRQKRADWITPAVFERWLALWREAPEQEGRDTTAALLLRAERAATRLRRSFWNEPAHVAAGEER